MSDRGIAQVVGSDSLQFWESLPTTEDISDSSEENKTKGRNQLQKD
mgnify:CR=1 FL=1